ncbi:MAG: caspase family protein [Planctomycetes bacterium]|nr:caspase family protein [Planctomycetota bacterium]
MPSPLPPSLGERFSIDEALPETPFERCFRAFDNVLGREVLLKLPASGVFAGWSAPVQERLLREARALAKIRHPAIAPILWVEPTADGPLLVLEPPAGELLADRLQRGPLEVDEVRALGEQVAAALACVHQAGVVHRAVGPRSIRLLPDGTVQLGAFTFAKEFGLRGQASSMAHAVPDGALRPQHLPDYSAPEQLAGQAADPRADVFALGCTLFRCLAGTDPFPPGQAAAAPPDLRRLRPEVDRALAQVVQRCLLFAKTARYAAARDVATALQAAAAPAAGGARRGWGLALALMAAVALLAWAWRSGGDDGRERGPKPTPGLGPEDASAPATARTFQPGYARVHGLFIAIGQAYDGRDWSRLQNPVREVDAVVARLQANDPQWQRPGAVVRLPERDATWEAIFGQLQRLEKEAEPEDAVLVYFAGHGARDGDDFALCAADVTGPIARAQGYLRREILTNFTKRCRAKHVLVVLDCCHSGAVFDHARGRDVADEALPGSHHTTRSSREFLCSAGADQGAADGLTLSPFCERLLGELGQPATAERDWIAARHLAGRIAEGMDLRRARVGLQQETRFRGDGGGAGSFVFRLAPAATGPAGR